MESNEKQPTILNRNPVLFYLLAQSGLGLVAALGFNVSAEVIVATMSFVNVLIMILANTMVMPVTTAQAKIEAALNTPVPQKDDAK